MNKKDKLYRFIKRVERNKLLTLFIKNIFDYTQLSDYNYIFRVINKKEMVVIDIYDNISEHRFNRYIFDFSKEFKDINNIGTGDVFLTYININFVKYNANKLCKFAYLFKLEDHEAINYATSFLDGKLINLLKKTS